MEIPTSVSSKVLEAGVLTRLIRFPYERCHVVYMLETSDFTDVAARLFSTLMDLPVSRTDCVACEIAQELVSRADIEALEYLIQAAVKGHPFSLSELLACSTRLHNLGVIRNRDDEYSEIAAQALLEDLKDFCEYEPEEIDWPDCDD